MLFWGYLFTQTHRYSNITLFSVSEFQQHKKLSPTRDEVILHTRKGKLINTSKNVFVGRFLLISVFYWMKHKSD